MLDRYGIISRQAVIAEQIRRVFHRCKRFVEVWKTPANDARSFVEVWVARKSPNV
ncbi:hypothetical protein ACLB1T_28555 [Escherichia coli]